MILFTMKPSFDYKRQPV